MPNVMAALSNIGGALCSTSQILADAQYWSAVGGAEIASTGNTSMENVSTKVRIS